MTVLSSQKPFPFQRMNRNKRNLIGFICLVAPALIWFLLIVGWPLTNMFYTSLLNWKNVLAPSTFIGLQNFRELFTTPLFYTALKTTLVYWLAVEAVALPVSFLLGFFLHLRLPGYRIFRTLFYLPALVSMPALSMMFMGVFLPNGMLNYLLAKVGLGGLTHLWLVDPHTALGTLIAIDIWGSIGFNSVFFFGALSDLPPDLVEAARIDGASWGQIAWRIAFPLVSDVAGVAFLLMFIMTLSGAVLPLLLTRGGPGTSTYTVGYYLYDMAFNAQRIGYSQAIGVFLFVVGILGTLIIRRVFRPRF
jgi:ABC-type sugar transport system permease subunit